MVKVRLRYFDQQEGAYQKQLMAYNLAKVQKEFPNVKASITDNEMQYENIAYTMPTYLPDMILKAAGDAGMKMEPRSSRGGTTSAMMVARFPEAMPGGSGIYSGQQSEHSVYEWCCVEEMSALVNLCESLITQIVNKK